MSGPLEIYSDAMKEKYFENLSDSRLICSI